MQLRPANGPLHPCGTASIRPGAKIIRLSCQEEGAAKEAQQNKICAGPKEKNGVPRHNSARRLCFEVRKEHPCSKSTVLRDLHAMDVTYSKRSLIPAGVATTDDWAAKRVLAGNQWVSSGDVNRVIFFSDEKIFVATDGEGNVWCFSGQEAPLYRKQRWTARLHVWGVIGVGYRKLVLLDG